MPKRFALSTLLLVMLLASLVFGYAQWRRQRLYREANHLKDLGVHGVAVQDGWFWPTLRQWHVDVHCVSYSPTIYNPPSFKCQDVAISADEAYAFYADIAERLRDLGYKKERITFRWHHYVTSTHHAKEIEQLDELKRPFFD